MDGVYRFHFKDNIAAREIEDRLCWAVFNAESLFGKPRVRLDASLYFDESNKSCVIDKSTDVGRHIAQVFTSLISKEFGEESFQVERLPQKEGVKNAEG